MNPSAWVFSLLTIVSWGAAAVFDKLTLGYLSPAVALTLRALFWTALVLIYGLGSGLLAALGSAPGRGVGYLFLSAILGLLGMAGYYSALNRAEASRIVPLTSAYPLVALLLAVLFLHEPMTGRKALGALLIVTGMWLLNEAGK
ncbi:MAG TPA: hypothetical protein EYP85_06205 [Armatimonadetes bacterium]|nr:hypothetical protein [Armatimonadota bacterium]